MTIRDPLMDLTLSCVHFEFNVPCILLENDRLQDESRFQSFWSSPWRRRGVECHSREFASIFLETLEPEVDLFKRCFEA